MNTWIAGSRPLKPATFFLPWPRNRTLKGQQNEAALKQMGRQRPSPCLAYFHRSTPNLQLEHWPLEDACGSVNINAPCWANLSLQESLRVRSKWPGSGERGESHDSRCSHNQVRSENILQGHLLAKVLAPTPAYLPSAKCMLTVKTDSNNWNNTPSKAEPNLALSI